MEKAARKNIFVTAVLLTVIGACITFLLYRFYESEKLLGPWTVSLMLLLSVVFLLYRKSERITEHPFFSWILVSAYLITGILLCFPNVYVSEYRLHYLVLVVVAGFIGLSFSLMMLLGTFLILLMTAGLTLDAVLIALLTLITMLNVASEREKNDLFRQTIGVFAVEAVMVLLTGKFLNSTDTLLKGFMIILLYFILSMIVFLIRSNNVLVWSAFNYSMFDEEEKPAELVPEEEKEILREYTIAELCSLETAYYKKLKARFPKTCDRDTKTGAYARKVAGYAGADIELVQCACTYRNLTKLCTENTDKESFIKGLMIPERLKTVIIRENTQDFRPSDFEEIIAYAAHETVSAYLYLKKQRTEVDVREIVESVCTLLLRKGIVRDCLLSMSLFHRMKQGLCDYFAEFFEAEG
ncbi:MAG: hypothetical protein J6U10_00715 [Lachnospiraceae bacterium]|nr:hypothetical protein [Lachnospiraceae bacterium]